MLTSVSPYVYALGGGVTVTVTGSGLVPISLASDAARGQDQLAITVAGTPCDVHFANLSTAVCTLREHAPISSVFGLYNDGRALADVPLEAEPLRMLGMNAWYIVPGGPL
ncbi:MAG: IPT/TIG domain-containing protein, partial [bacterium]